MFSFVILVGKSTVDHLTFVKFQQSMCALCSAKLIQESDLDKRRMDQNVIVSSNTG